MSCRTPQLSCQGPRPQRLYLDLHSPLLKGQAPIIQFLCLILTEGHGGPRGRSWKLQQPVRSPWDPVQGESGPCLCPQQKHWSLEGRQDLFENPCHPTGEGWVTPAYHPCSCVTPRQVTFSSSGLQFLKLAVGRLTGLSPRWHWFICQEQTVQSYPSGTHSPGGAACLPHPGRFLAQEATSCLPREPFCECHLTRWVI